MLQYDSDSEYKYPDLKSHESHLCKISRKKVEESIRKKHLHKTKIW